MPLPMASGSPFEGFPLTLYGRVSKDQRGGRSVSQQLRRGRRWATEHRCVTVGEFSDNDRSVSRYSTKEREDWPKVEAQIRSGETRILWIYEISRSTRDLEVWIPLVRVCRDKGVYIVLDEDVYDPTKPSDMRQLNQMMVDAEYESDKTAARIKRDAEEIAEEGRPWGVAGFGYKREYDPDTGDLIRQTPDPEQAKLILKIAGWIEEGKSPNAVAEKLNRDGVPTPGGTVAGQIRTRQDGTTYTSRGWNYQVVYKLVTRHSMMGKRFYRGKIKSAGGWDPVIEPDRWELIREKLAPTPRGREGAVVYLLSGLAVCDICDGPVYGFVRTGRASPAYRCAGPYDGAPGGKAHVQRAVHLLEEHVTGMLFDRFSDPDVVSALQQGDGGGHVQEARHRMVALQRELEELYADVTAGQVSRRMAMADESRLRRAMQELEPQTRARADDPLVQMLVDGDPEQVWAGWDLGQRRSALKMVTEPRGVRVLKVGPVGRRKVLASESVLVAWAGTGS